MSSPEQTSLLAVCTRISGPLGGGWGGIACVALEEEIPVPCGDDRDALIAALEEKLQADGFVEDEEFIPVPDEQQQQQQPQHSDQHFHV